LNTYLKELGVDEVHVVGLAFDFCVGNTAKDSARNGFTTKILMKATREISEKTSTKMKEELTESGVLLIDY